jgi:glycosyltransferase involved in cell wall biosynthesis
VVIPLYNERDSIQELYEKLTAVLSGYACASYELLYINDGSDDGSTEQLDRLAADDPHVRIIHLRRCYGKSTALSVGFDQVESDIVITMDADLQDEPSEIPRFISKLEEGYDLVSGWKEIRHDPFEKRAASRIFNAVVSRTVGIPLHDFNCGFKAYRKEVIKNVDIYGEFHRFIPVLAGDKGYRITEIAIQHHARKHGRSKYGMSRYFIGFFDFLSILFITRYSQRPFHLLGGWAAAAALTGLVLLLYTAIMKFGFGLTGVRPALFLGFFLWALTLNLLIFGFITDLIVSVMRHEHARPMIYVKRVSKEKE